MGHHGFVEHTLGLMLHTHLPLTPTLRLLRLTFDVDDRIWSLGRTSVAPFRCARFPLTHRSPAVRLTSRGVLISCMAY